MTGITQGFVMAPRPRKNDVLLTTTLLTLPVAAALGVLVVVGWLAPLPALAAAAFCALVVAALVWRHLRDIEILRHVADGLRSPEREQVPAVAEGSLVAGLDGSLRRHRREWRAQDEHLRTQLAADEIIIDSLPDPILTLDQQMRLVRANAASRSVLSRVAAGQDLLATLRHPNVIDAVQRTLEEGTGQEAEFTLPGVVDRAFSARVRRLSEQSADGAVLVLTLHDLTEVKRADRMRADFVANASHELRTPLSALIGFVETLRGPAAGDARARARFLGIMQEQAGRMARLINDLLSLSRIELSEHARPTQHVDLVAAMRRAAESLQLQAQEKEMSIDLRLELDPAPVIGDGDQLEQVAQNLVDNAIKYGPAGTAVTVTVATSGRGPLDRLAPGESVVSVSVHNAGDGIAPEHLPRLTERFYRIDPARSRELGGTGLGLAIAKHIVNRHRGSLTIESSPGRGATFSVYLVAAENAPQRPADRRRNDSDEVKTARVRYCNYSMPRRDRMTRWKPKRPRLGPVFGSVSLAALICAGAADAGETVTVTMTKEQWETLQNLLPRLNQLESQVQDNAQNLRLQEGQTQNINQRVEQISGTAVNPDRIPDEGSLVNSGKKGMTFELSGQVNMGVMAADSGDGPGITDNDRKVWVVDNDNSSSRFRFKVRAPIDDHWSAGATMELEVEQNASNEVNQDDDETRSFDFNLRKAEAFIKNKEYGKITVGQGDMASNGISEQDLSGTTVAGKSEVETIGGGLDFRLDPSGVLSGNTVNDYFDNLDGLSRQQRVRYDTPTFAGFSLSTSYGDGGQWDARGQYKQKLDVAGGLKVVAAAGWYTDTDVPNNEGVEGISGSASVLHVPTGLFVTGAYGTVLDTATGTDPEPSFYYVKGGIQQKWFSFGKTAVSGNVWMGWDYLNNGSESDNYGVQLVQNVDASGTEIYFGGNYFSVTDPAEDPYQDIWVGLLGVRQKF
ncbi:MAG: PAS domain-containing protein [Alphaproteobacteria bacterium]|nr:PAS domain-containing protein [Alphaproteobacteria bacterium]